MKKWYIKQVISLFILEDDSFAFHASLKGVPFEVITLQVNPICLAMIGSSFWADLGDGDEQK